VKKLVLLGVLVIEVKEAVLVKQVRQDKDVEVESVVADNQAVNDEAAEGHCLRGGGDFKGVFDGF